VLRHVQPKEGLEGSCRITTGDEDGEQAGPGAGATVTITTAATGD